MEQPGSTTQSKHGGRVSSIGYDCVLGPSFRTCAVTHIHTHNVLNSKHMSNICAHYIWVRKHLTGCRRSSRMKSTMCSIHFVCNLRRSKLTIVHNISLSSRLWHGQSQRHGWVRGQELPITQVVIWLVTWSLRCKEVENAKQSKLSRKERVVLVWTRMDSKTGLRTSKSDCAWASLPNNFQTTPLAMPSPTSVCLHQSYSDLLHLTLGIIGNHWAKGLGE